MAMISKALAQLPQKPHALYRFYDSTDVLLYVGITGHLPSRMAAHRRDKPWWVQVRNINVEYHDTRRDALRAEAEAIRSEKPLYNNTHNELVSVPDDIPEVVTWTPHGPRTGAITVQWIEANWQKMPANIRDRVEVPAYDEGRRGLAEDILEWFSAEERAELRAEGQRQAEDEGDEFPYGVVEADAYISGRAALAAFAQKYEDAKRLEAAIDFFLGHLPAEVREPAMDRARHDVEGMSEAEYTELDVKCWGMYRLAYAFREGEAVVSRGEPPTPTDPWPEPSGASVARFDKEARN